MLTLKDSDCSLLVNSAPACPNSSWLPCKESSYFCCKSDQIALVNNLCVLNNGTVVAASLLAPSVYKLLWEFEMGEESERADDK
jgi:hypothetical protein